MYGTFCYARENNAIWKNSGSKINENTTYSLHPASEL